MDTKNIKNVNEISNNQFSYKLNYMKAKTSEYQKIVDTLHVFISEGNRKTGKLVPSVSLRPVLDCGNCKVCSKLCYDVRNDCRYSSVMDTRVKNFVIWKGDSKRYFDEISDFCKLQIAFRWHVGGDIINKEYFEGMVRVANENKHCQFLVFTKRFNIVNEYLSTNTLPNNLQIIFSCWKGLEVPNPYNLPTSEPIFKNDDPNKANNNYLCSGNCSECFIHKKGCFALNKGKKVVFIAH